MSEPSLTRDDVKRYFQENLLRMVDLRRMDAAELRGAALREKVEHLARDTLRRLCPASGLSSAETLVEEMVDESIGLGPLEALLRDSTITEIMVNGPNAIYIERNGRIENVSVTFSNVATLRTAIDRIVSPLGRRIDESCPMVDARLSDGSRVNAILPPVSLGGPLLTIRKFSRVPISMERLVQLGSVSPAANVFLAEAVRLRRNLLIAGGTGSGKTTLLNALAGFIPSGERIVTIEDAAELKLQQDHVVALEARPPNVEGKGEITIRDLVRNALRMRPDRIVVGECRGGEALDMLQAMNTGHDGSLTTIHANSPRDALLRVETMVMMAGFDLPLRAIREQVAGAIDLILFQTRDSTGARKVTHVTEICGTEEGVILTHDLFYRPEPSGSLLWTGRVPRFAERLTSESRRALLQLLGPQRIPDDTR